MNYLFKVLTLLNPGACRLSEVAQWSSWTWWWGLQNYCFFHFFRIIFWVLIILWLRISYVYREKLGLWWCLFYVLWSLKSIATTGAQAISKDWFNLLILFTTVLNHPPEIKKSAKWSESSSDTTMTSPATKIFFKIGPLEDFEKMRVLYVAMA